MSKHKFYQISNISNASIMVNRIGGVMVSMITASAIDRRFELRLGQIKN